MARLTEACTIDGCPFHGTIEDLDKAVFKGNGHDPLTVQISNLATQIRVTHKLIMGECALVCAIVAAIDLWFRK